MRTNENAGLDEKRQRSMEQITVTPLPQRQQSKRVYTNKQQKQTIKNKPKQQRQRPATKPLVVNDNVTVRAPQRVRGHPNNYLRSLLDPERYRDVKIPETYARATAMYGPLSNEDIPFLGETGVDNPIEPEGSYYGVSTSSITEPILVYDYRTSGNNTDALSCAFSQQTAQTGLTPITPGGFSDGQQANSLMVSQGSTVNIKGPWTSTGASAADSAQPPFKGALGNTEYYGFPVYGTGVALGAAVAISSSYSGMPATGILQVAAVTENGETPYKNVTLTAGQPWSIVAFTNADLTPILVPGPSSVAGFGYPRPGLGFRIRNVGTNGDIPLTGVQVTVSGASSNSGKRYGMFPIEYPDKASMVTNIDQYRMNSMSQWIQFQGSTLNNAGQHAALMYRGGRSPMENGLIGYESIAETPGSYQGALKDGSYGFWVPSNTDDVLFQSVGKANSQKWEHPYIVFGGLIGDITSQPANALRLRMAANYEFVSKSQMYTYSYAKGHYLEMVHAVQALRDVETTMENPIHWQRIKEILKKGFDAAKDIGTWVNDNKSWIVPGVTAVGSLLL